MTVGWDATTTEVVRRLKERAPLQGWQAGRVLDEMTTAADLAHAIRFGRAQSALEAVAAGGAGLTSDHARAIHFVNEMAELRHYEPLITVDDDVPVLADGVSDLIARFDDLGLWQGERAWEL